MKKQMFVVCLLSILSFTKVWSQEKFMVRQVVNYSKSEGTVYTDFRGTVNCIFSEGL